MPSPMPAADAAADAAAADAVLPPDAIPLMLPPPDGGLRSPHLANRRGLAPTPAAPRLPSPSTRPTGPPSGDVTDTARTPRRRRPPPRSTNSTRSPAPCSSSGRRTRPRRRTRCAGRRRASSTARGSRSATHGLPRARHDRSSARGRPVVLGARLLVGMPATLRHAASVTSSWRGAQGGEGVAQASWRVRALRPCWYSPRGRHGGAAGWRPAQRVHAGNGESV